MVGYSKRMNNRLQFFIKDKPRTAISILLTAIHVVVMLAYVGYNFNNLLQESNLYRFMTVTVMFLIALFIATVVAVAIEYDWELITTIVALATTTTFMSLWLASLVMNRLQLLVDYKIPDVSELFIAFILSMVIVMLSLLYISIVVYLSGTLFGKKKGDYDD